MFKTRNRHARFSLTVLAVMTVASYSVVSLAQESTVKAAISEQSKAETAAADSQDRINKLDDESTQMLAEYRQLNSEAQSLKSYNDQMARTVASQRDELSSMQDQLAQIDTTSKEVLPMMVRMLDTLDEFVKLDMPFLMDEREERIAKLRDMMSSADVTISEKYRRIVEAYQIEMEYGRTIESYEGKVNDKSVDFLRIGRIALMYQTSDGSETGYWNKDQKAYIVDNDYKDAVKKGLKIAKKQAAPDLLIVPVHAPQEAK